MNIWGGRVHSMDSSWLLCAALNWLTSIPLQFEYFTPYHPPFSLSLLLCISFGCNAALHSCFSLGVTCPKIWVAQPTLFANNSDFKAVCLVLSSLKCCWNIVVFVLKWRTLLPCVCVSRCPWWTTSDVDFPDPRGVTLGVAKRYQNWKFKLGTENNGVVLVLETPEVRK